MRVRKLRVVKCVIYIFAIYGFCSLFFVTYPLLEERKTRILSRFSVNYDNTSGKTYLTSPDSNKNKNDTKERVLCKDNEATNKSEAKIPLEGIKLSANVRQIQNVSGNKSDVITTQGHPPTTTLPIHTPLPRTSTVTDFQQIQTNVRVYVYSAYYNDRKSPPAVTVIGLGLLAKMPTRVTCRFSRTLLSNKTRGDKGIPVNASRLNYAHATGYVIRMPDSHRKPFGAIFVHCAVSTGMPQPQHVSLIFDKSQSPLVYLKINYPDPGPPRWQTALCLSPLHSNYSNWQQAVETLELVKILGADHVSGYVTSVSNDAQRVLNHYVARGFMTLHQWRGPPEPVHYYGQIAAINDCLFRMRHVARMVVFTDLDEVIVPKGHKTWMDMLDALKQRTNDSDRIAVFTFRNAFFYQTPQDRRANVFLSTDKIIKIPGLTSKQVKDSRWLGLKSPRHLYRTHYVWGWRDRSKMIVDPLRVAMLGIHFPYHLAKGYRELRVHPDLALLHHYRKWTPQKTVRDTSALKFAPQLIDSVKRTWSELRKPGLQDI